MNEVEVLAWYWQVLITAGIFLGMIWFAAYAVVVLNGKGPLEYLMFGPDKKNHVLTKRNNISFDNGGIMDAKRRYTI